MADRFADMVAFAKAADLGSFTAAAAALGLSPQMVGKHVSALEARLGARLLTRTTRRQSLTEAGRAYRERCRAILADLDAAEAMVHALGTTPRGRLRVGAPVTFGACCLAPLVARFLQRYPEVEVDLALSDRFVDVVAEGYDAVVRLGPLADSGLKARALVPYRLVACASPAYLDRRGSPAAPGDLAAHDCLGFVYWSGFPFAEWRFERDGLTHAVEVRSRFRINDARALRRAALDGFGIVLQADFILRDDLAAGRLVEVLPGYAAPARPMHLLFPADGPSSPKLRGFVDAVVEVFGPGARGGAGQPRKASSSAASASGTSSAM